MSNNNIKETIISLATPSGTGALAILRISGKSSITITNTLFKGTDLNQVATHTVHLGKIIYQDEVIDEVLVTVFKNPHSFTKEDSIEITCHGSPFIVEKITRAFLNNGAVLAKPGEFSMRAYLNGRFDLTQAEAISDLINADSEIAHQTALKQMKGGFSEKIKTLRTDLIWFASLIELELDFGEEDVTFAARTDLELLIIKLLDEIKLLVNSFATGNIIKNGIPVVIAGKPNTGKSTLLNTLLNEERAIVSAIPGTTRDVIEEVLYLNGLAFRFMDTAGLRDTTDVIEKIGVEKSGAKMKEASLILYLMDITQLDENNTNTELDFIEAYLKAGKKVIFVANKADLATQEQLEKAASLLPDPVFISARNHSGLSTLQERIVDAAQDKYIFKGDTVVTNLRHFEHLTLAQRTLQKAFTGLKSGITGDILAMDIRHALYELGQITGEITNQDLLNTIFSKFCIGK